MAALASLRQMVKLAAQEIVQKLQVRQQRAIRSLEASRPNEWKTKILKKKNS